MHASEIIEQFESLGYRLQLGANGKLLVRPNPPPDEAPRLAPLARLVLRYREEVIRVLQSERPETSDAPEMSAPIPMLPLDLCRIADAVAANPRSPILTDMALAVFARVILRYLRLKQTAAQRPS